MKTSFSNANHSYLADNFSKNFDASKLKFERVAFNIHV